MEAAIRTPEILDLIFQYLRFTSEFTTFDERYGHSHSHSGKTEFLHRWVKKRVTLLNAGLTCRAFFAPAMANLWWTVNGIMPFVKLLPNVHCKKAVQSGYHYVDVREWYLENDLLEEDLTRFDFYAKQVTHIIDLGRTGEDNVANVLIQLAELRPSPKCFPKLRTVRTNSYNPDPLLFFTSPTLQKLNLRGYWSEERFKTMCGVIGRLARRSQDLQLLDIPYIPSREGVNSLLRLQNIRHLSFRQSVASSLNFPDLMTSLAELPRLEKMEVNCTSIGGDFGAIPGIGARGAGAGASDAESTSAPSSSTTTTTTPWFPSLISIILAGTPTNIITVLHHLESTPLLEIGLKVCWAEIEDFSVPPVEAADEINTMTQTIHRHFHSTLTSVSLEYQLGNGVYIIPGSVARMSITLDSILPLLGGIPQLETLLIDHTFSIPNLTDTFLQSVAEGCPELVRLSLPTSGTSVSPVFFSFAGVQRLVGELPRLRELKVDFNALSGATPGVVAPHLRVLDVRSSPIRNKRSTAVNIARAFPNLETLQYARDTHHRPPTSSAKSGHPGLWREVVEWLPVITGKYNAGNCASYDLSDEEMDLVTMMMNGGSRVVRDFDYETAYSPSVTPNPYLAHHLNPPAPPTMIIGGPGTATSESSSDDPLGYGSEY